MIQLSKINNGIKAKLKTLRDYNKIAGIDKIARRYFVMNAFDGVLAVLGILLGTFMVQPDQKIVVTTGLAAGIAMGVSGIWGAYLTERAERQMELKELERATLSKLKGTKIGKAASTAVIVIAVIDGLAPFIAAAIILSPFIFLTQLLTVNQMYIISAATAFLVLFLLGIFLGRISKENIIKTGAIMILAGIVSLAISFLLLGRAA